MALFAPVAAGADAVPAYFVRDGRLLEYAPADKALRPLVIQEAKSAEPPSVKHYWGRMEDGRLVVGLGETAEFDENHSERVPGESIALLRADGTLEQVIAEKTARAFPSPKGARIALVNEARDLTIWENGATRAFTIDGKVSHLCWAADGDCAALTVFPPDWYPEVYDQLKDFQKLPHYLNSDIYLANLAQGTMLGRVTDDASTDYNPFFSADGSELYYVWLDSYDNKGSLMRVSLAADGKSIGGNAKPQAIAAIGKHEGEVPVGRVGTYAWSADGGTLLFEAGTPEGPQPAGEIWTIGKDGGGAEKRMRARHPQQLRPGEFAFIDDAGSVQSLTLPAQENAP